MKTELIKSEIWNWNAYQGSLSERDPEKFGSILCLVRAIKK